MAEEFIVLINTGLNQSSVQKVQTELNNLTKKRNIDINVKLTGDNTQLQNIITSLNNIHTASRTPITLTMDATNVTQQIADIRQQLNDLARINFNLGGTGQQRRGAITEVQRAYREIRNIQTRINTKTKQGAKLISTNNVNQIQELMQQIESLEQRANDLFRQFGNQFSLGQFDTLRFAMEKINEDTDLLRAKLQDVFQNGINTGKFDNNISELEARFNKLGSTNQTIANNIRNARTAYTNFVNSIQSGNIDEAIQYFINFNNIIETTNNLLNGEGRTGDTQVLQSDRNIFIAKLNEALINNANLSEQARTRITAMIAEVQNADKQNLNRLKKEFTDIITQANSANSIFGQIGNALRQQFSFGNVLTTIVSQYLSVYKVFQYIKEGINTVRELDTALIDLQKTSEASAKQLSEFYYEANDIAKEYGSTTQEIIQSTADWSRLGFSLDDSKLMAQYSSMLKSISSDLNIDEATNGLVSIMKAYGIEAEDALDGIVSKINKIGNEFATSNGEIITGLQNSSAAMAVMGTTLDETIALFTAAQEITQDASKVGNALRSMSMRIRGYDEETNELSEDLSNISGEVINLTKTVNNQNGISLFTDETQTEYKSIYTYLQEISKIYDELDAKTQQELLEKLFGKNRASVGAAIIKNFQAAEEAMVAMGNSAGNAQAEMDVISESLDYKLNKLSETGTGIAQNLFAREDMKVIVDVLTEVLSLIDGLTSAFGLFGSVILVGVIPTILQFVSALQSAGTAFGAFQALFITNPSMIAIVTVIAAIGLIIKTISDFVVTAKEANQAMIDSFAEYEEAKSHVEELNNELKTTQDRINDLQSKGNLTFTEQSELDKLREKNRLLKIQADLEEKAVIREGKETAKDTLSAYEKNFKHEISSNETERYYNDYSHAPAGLLSDFSNISAMIAGIKAFTELRDEANDLDDFNFYNEQIEYATNKVWEQVRLLEEYHTKLTSIPESYLNSEQKNALTEISSSIEYIYKELDPNKWKQIELDDIFNQEKYYSAKQELIELAKETNNVGITVDDVKRKYPDLLKAISGTTLTIEDIVESINAEAGIIDFDKLKNNLITQYTQSFGGANSQGQNEQYKQFTDWVSNLSEDELRLVYEIMLDTDTAYFDLNKWQNELKARLAQSYVMKLSLDIDAETEKLDNIVSALEESASSTGLTVEAISNLNSIFSVLSGYDSAALFEQTAHGVHVNREELSKLQTQYKEFQRKKFYDELSRLQEGYEKTVKEIDTLTVGSKEWHDAISKKDAISQEIEKVNALATQYNALTSAYNTWVLAQEGTNERDSYESVGSGYEDAKNAVEQGWYGDKSLNAYLDLMLSAEKRTGNAIEDFKKLDETIAGTSHSLMDYWQYDSDDNLVTDGLFDFLKDVNSKLGEEFVNIDEDGKYSFDFSGDKLQQVADAFGTTTEMVQLFERALIDAGMAVDLGDTSSLSTMEFMLNEVNNTLEAIGEKPVSVNLDPSNVEEAKISIDNLENVIQSLKNEDGSLKCSVDEYEYATSLLSSLIYKKMQLENPVLMSIKVDDSESATNVDKAIGLIQDLQASYAALEALSIQGADTSEVETQIANIISQLKGLQSEDFDIEGKLGIDLDASVENIKTQIQKITKEAFTNFGVTEEQFGITNTNQVIELEFNPITDAVDTYLAEPKTITLTPDGTAIDTYLNNLSAVITLKIGGFGIASGTANESGTAFANGTAYTKGDWRLGKNVNSALMGELGQEMIVRDGKWFTVGDTGAEFVNGLRKDDIIFNADQTKQLLSNGKITGSNRRGRALVGGTALALNHVNDKMISPMEIAYDDGNGVVSITVDTINNNRGTDGQERPNTNPEITSGDTKQKVNQDDLFDWIEVLIDRIERAISSYEKKADNAFSSWEDRSQALTDQQAFIRDEINYQKQGYDRYIQQANEIGLDEVYASKVRDGTIDIEEITDKDLLEQIQAYQEWYEKALDCRDAVDDLNISLSETYQTSFDNVITQYDGLLASIEHKKTMLDESIAQSEAKGYSTSIKYYEAQIAAEQELIDAQIKLREELIAKRDEAVASGAIVKGSEAWVEMNAEIDSCVQSIAEANTNILDFNNSLRETEWQIFDMLQDKISNVTDEASFLIDLMSNDKMYDDKGNLTSEGMTTMGLRGQNYNTYMTQAELYAEEMARLDAEIADDPYNQTLIDRRQELLELQQESILAAEDEKQAIIDMVEEGIEPELDSLQELIDSYTEALDSQKDLYDYQKKVAEQTKNIAALEKQLAAYKGNDSEEIKAKVQQIKVSLEEAKSNLEETEYDKFATDQKKLLDDLFTEYEDVLNERLDNIDGLIEDVVSEINANSELINQTLSEKADSVGYTIGEEIKNIWDGEDGSKSIITTYGEDFKSASTTTNSTLATINSNLRNMISQLNVLAETDIQGEDLSSVNEYASGVHNVKRNENAWTQEGNEEYIVRPSDGAILTPLAKRDSVFNTQASQNLWDVANDPAKFIRSYMDFDKIAVPTASGHKTDVIQNFENIVFSMPNVTNYEGMLASMKKDKNFERFIQAMTIGRIAGGSSLAIGKSF